MWLNREIKNIHRILAGNLKRDTPLDDVGIGGRKTKMDLQEIGWQGGTGLTF